jgi:phosphate transport system substrate-binding protein
VVHLSFTTKKPSLYAAFLHWTLEQPLERNTTLIAPLRSSRTRLALVAFVVPALLLSACGSSSKSSSSSSGSGNVTLNGSGSTFQQTFDQTVIQAFQNANKGITVNYAGGGSGKGKTDLQTKTVDFAGTDSLVKDVDLPHYQGGAILYFPTVAAPITVSYNLSGVDSLKLSAPTLAKIFSGKITKWNDSAIAADGNTGLPDKDIVIVHRAEASGTTSNFTKYLDSAATSDWTLGSGDTVNWPSSSQAGQGNSGVAQTVSSTDGAIGYVDFSDALAAKLKFASIKNSSGSFVAPTLGGASAAVAASTIQPNLTYNPLNQAGADVYPITSPTWIIIYEKQTNAATGNALKSFLTFTLNEGQGLAAGVNYAKLPTSLQQKAIAQLSKIQIPA